MSEPGSLVIENAKIIFRNFAGREGQMNAEGDRNFSVVLDPDTARAMAEDGWNVRELKPRDGEDQGDLVIQVSVKFKFRPPEIYLVTGNHRTRIDEDMLELLDTIDIENVDLIINPYSWAVGNKTGIKAYLKKMFVVVAQDDLDRKYEHIPLAGSGEEN